jgi:hypothetical protein
MLDEGLARYRERFLSHCQPVPLAASAGADLLRRYGLR